MKIPSATVNPVLLIPVFKDASPNLLFVIPVEIRNLEFH